MTTMIEAAVRHQVAPPVSPAQIARWQADLEAHVPRFKPGQETLSWLYLRWHAGDPWAPKERFLVWHVWPKGMCPWGWDNPDDPREPGPIRAELEGPHPRSTGHFCGGRGWCPSTDDGAPICTEFKYRWVGGPASLISLAQWEIFREVGAFADKYFVIQGHGGGHRVSLSPAEVALQRVQAMPKIGALPYAAPDPRTWAMLRAYDQLWTWTRQQTRRFEERTVEDQEAAEREIAERAAVQQLKLLDEQIEGFWDEHGKMFRDVAMESRGNLGDYRNAKRYDGDGIAQRFIAAQVSNLY